MKNSFLLLFCIFYLSTFSQNYFRKFKDLDNQTVSIVGDDFIVEAEIIKPDNEHRIKIKDTRTYAWFNSGQIQNTQGGYDSRLLHGDFVSKYLNKGLKEKGIYKYGLKKGVWKQWYENGNLKSISKWKAGLTQGKFIQYDENKQISKSGKYKNGKLSGTVIDYKDGQVISIDKYYKGLKKVKELKTKTANKNKESNTKEKKAISNNQKGNRKIANFNEKLKAFFTFKKKEKTNTKKAETTKASQNKIKTKSK